MVSSEGLGVFDSVAIGFKDKGTFRVAFLGEVLEGVGGFSGWLEKKVVGSGGGFWMSPSLCPPPEGGGGKRGGVPRGKPSEALLGMGRVKGLRAPSSPPFHPWIPAFAGMTGVIAGMAGG